MWPSAKAFGQIGSDAKLIGSDAAAQDSGPYIREPGLLLTVNADVVAIDIRGRIFVFGRIELETDALFQFGEEAIGSVPVLKKEILQSRLLAVLAKLVAGTEDLGYAACYWQHLFGPDKRIQSHSKMRLGGKTAADANGESGFCSAETLAREGGQADVVDLRIRAPDVAAGDGHFELAGQVVELGVAREMTIELESEGRRIVDFVGIETGKRAAGDSAGHVAASAGGSQAHAIELIKNVRQGLYRHPVQLNVLTHRNIGDSARILLRKVSDCVQLLRSEQTVGDANTHHEKLRRLPFAAHATGNPGSVALGVYAPGTEIRPEPLGRDGTEPIAGERADFVEVLPGILFPFEPLHLLRFGFLDFGHWSCLFRCKNRCKKKKPTCFRFWHVGFGILI